MNIVQETACSCAEAQCSVQADQETSVCCDQYANPVRIRIGVRRHCNLCFPAHNFASLSGRGVPTNKMFQPVPRGSQAAPLNLLFTHGLTCLFRDELLAG